MKSILCEKIKINNRFENSIQLINLLLVLYVLVHRLRTLSDPEHGLPWLLAMLCESWFAFELVLSLSTNCTPVEFKTYPERLLESRSDELPAVDMMVTTADPDLEPAIMTVNTVLSLMAVDYPADKLACYVSDDAGSSLLLHALVEASGFARLWIPFCKKYGVRVRAPFKYFASDHCRDDTIPSAHWKDMKDEYERLCVRVEEAAKGGVDTDKKHHPSIVKVISENKGDPEGLPHLIYVCREKRPTYPHHNKAGAMNVLTRVSGLMTNAPYMLNVDCDMFANNPTIVLQAMCAFTGLKPQDCAFVQFPQVFYNILKDDPFGTQMAVGNEIIGRGMAGIQGPLYAGTGCFHRRKLIYGFSLDSIHPKQSSEEELKELFGASVEFVGSVGEVIRDDGLVHHIRPRPLSSLAVEAATEIARCDSELGTAWGKKVGWGYGSVTEDVLTGLRIHSKGWRSVSLMPDPPGFLGLAATSGPTSFVQRKRWVAGMLQILVGPANPMLLNGIQLRQSLAYTWVLMWGPRSIPDFCYALLPAFSLITASPFLPKAHEPAMVIFAAQFLTHHLYTLYLYLKCGLSVQSWWNNLRIGKIISSTCNLFGTLSFVFQLVGISDISFDVTQKDQSESSVEDTVSPGKFTFNESPMFVPGTTLLLLHLTALAMTVLFGRRYMIIDMAGELLSSVFVVLCFLPFLKGLFGKGKYGIPSSTIFKSVAFTFCILQLCKRPVH